jgi:hypothetical protein
MDGNIKPKCEISAKDYEKWEGLAKNEPHFFLLLDGKDSFFG